MNDPTSGFPENAVLVLEEDDSVRRAYERLLASAGHVSRGFASGEDLRARAGSGGGCCLICDHPLRGMPIAELRAGLEADGNRVWLVLVTSRGEVESGPASTERGRLSRHRKPVGAEELLGSVDTGLRWLREGR